MEKQNKKTHESYGMKEKVTVPEGISGEYSIEKFLVDREDWSSLSRGRGIPFGEYTRLMRNGDVMMSDTPSEMKDHSRIIYMAKGNVLIAGLGIGFVLQEIIKKEEVNYVTVVEISQDVINLVWPHYKKMFGNKIEIIHDDILTWKPPKGIKYDYAWYDIWDYICSDNLEDMKKLHRRFGKRTGWQGSWARELCRRNM